MTTEPSSQHALRVHSCSLYAHKVPINLKRMMRTTGIWIFFSWIYTESFILLLQCMPMYKHNAFAMQCKKVFMKSFPCLSLECFTFPLAPYEDDKVKSSSDFT